MSQVLHDPPSYPARIAPDLPWTYESFPELLERLNREGFTGKILFDFKDGLPRVATTSRKRVQIKGLTRR